MTRPRRKLRASKRPSYDWHKHHKWIPDPLPEAIGRADKFKDNPRCLMQLGYRWDMKGNKAMYAPFRFAVSQTIMFLLAHLDLLTMRIGRYDEESGKFVPYSVNQIVARIDLGKRRFQRSGHQLKKYLNAIALYPRAEQIASDVYVGYAWARRLTVSLFKAMGLYHKLVIARTQAYQRAKGVPYREALAAEGVVTLDPGSEPLDPREVAQAFGMTIAEFIAPDTS